MRKMFNVRLTEYIHTVLPVEVSHWYAARALKTSLTRSAIVREVLIDYYEKQSGKTVERREYQP